MVIIGLGSGRSGTASLAKLLNAQNDALCFHEMNPSCVRHAGTPQPILNGVREMAAIVEGGDPSMLTVDLARAVAAKAYDELRTMSAVSLLGDIAHYYLTYVEEIIALGLPVRFICLKRDRGKTITSWLRKTKEPSWPSKRLADAVTRVIIREVKPTERNPWMDHDGSQYAIDPIWDKCFPKFPGPTREAAAAQYYDYYYEKAEALEGRYGALFRIVQTEQLDNHDFQSELLTFCGVAVEDHVYTDAHIHKGG